MLERRTGVRPKRLTIEHQRRWWRRTLMRTYPLPARSGPSTNDELHPLVYRSIVALTVWLVLSIWALFSRGAYEGLTLSVITLFFLVLVGIPVILWLTWRHNTEPDMRRVQPYAEWASHAFETWTGRVSGLEASMQILLPIAAVAIGMTIFGLVFMFTVPNLNS